MPKNPKQTSKKVASDAGKTLQKNNSTKKTLEFAATAVAQAPLKPKAKSRKK